MSAAKSRKLRHARSSAASLDALPEFLTIPEVRAVLRVSRATAYALAKELSAVRFGPRVLRIPKAALVAKLEKLAS